MLKIVHINTFDTGGGAAIAAVRHTEAMRQAGYDTSFICLKKSGSRQDVQTYIHSRFSIFIELVKEKVICMFRNHCLGTVGLFSINYSSQPLHRLPVIQDADVIFLHWVNMFVDTDEIEKILHLGKPTFWFMHDMYPITGGCHHSLGCKKYTVECGSCPLVKKHFPVDFARRTFLKKVKSLNGYQNLAFVTPSRWLGGCVENSRIARGHNVFVVPNVIDTNLFRPLDIDAKQMLGLDSRKKTILFNACDFSSIYKGSRYVFECLKKCDPNLYEGLVIGNADQELLHSLPINVICTGLLYDEASLVVAYNACDTFVISSIAENYPNVVMEAMACGKPCVGFPTGGIPELINHQVTGYVTKNISADELSEGIKYVFDDNERYASMSKYAREQIIKNNSYDNCSEIYHGIEQYFTQLESV